jgi:hypothetical protein
MTMRDWLDWIGLGEHAGLFERERIGVSMHPRILHAPAHKMPVVRGGDRK